MPRIRRWHPIAHDFNRDPEVIELRKRFGDWVALAWQEILSVADRNEGQFKGKPQTIAAALSPVSLSKRPTLSEKTLIKAFQYMEQCGWIEIKSDHFLVPNYMNFRPSEARKKHFQERRREANDTPPFLPSLPSLNGFVLLWSLHPGPKGPKRDALKAYKEIKPPEGAVEALKAQIGYKAECDKRGVFCAPLPHLHRWIKKRRWEDEIPAVPVSQAERLWREAQEEKKREP